MCLFYKSMAVNRRLLVRATAVGTTDLSAKTSHGEVLNDEQIKNRLIEAFSNQEVSAVNDIYHSPTLHVYDVVSSKKVFFLQT